MTITVLPREGYVLESLVVTDEVGNVQTHTNLGNSQYTFMMPAGKVTVKAVFVPVQ